MLQAKLSSSYTPTCSVGKISDYPFLKIYQTFSHLESPFTSMQSFKSIISRHSLRLSPSLRFSRPYSSTEDIAAQQHSGSRSAPKPTAETGTSGQAPDDAPASEPPQGKPLAESHQQKNPPQEDGEAGSPNYMSKTEDNQGGEIKSNSPFRAAPLHKKAGYVLSRLPRLLELIAAAPRPSLQISRPTSGQSRGQR